MRVKYDRCQDENRQSEGHGMAGWTTADFAILGIAAFIAVTSLVRLMNNRRDELLRNLEEQAQQARQTKTEAERVAPKK